MGRESHKIDMKLFLIVLIAVAISVILLSVRLFFGKAFVKTHVDQNNFLRKQGIHCAQSQDAAARLKGKKRI